MRQHTESRTLLSISVLIALIAISLGGNPGTIRIAHAGGLVVNSYSDYPADCAVPGRLCLREAIAAAAPGDLIMISIDGPYFLDISVSRGTLNLTKDVTIQSSSDRVGILTSEGVLFNITSGVKVVLDNLSIGGSNWTGGLNNNGGAIYNAGTLTIKNSYVSGGAIYGGGLYNVSTAVIVGTNFGSSHATYGGAIYNAGSLTFIASGMDYNEASMDGGGLYNAVGATALISNSALGHNMLTGNGAGSDIVNYGALTVTNTTFRSGYLNNPPGIGLAVWTAQSGATTNLGSSIVTTWPLPPQGGVNELSGPIVSLGYNLIEDGTGSTGLTNGVNHDQVGTADARIDAKLSDNYGNFTYPPAPNSPAVSAGFCAWSATGIIPAPPPVTIDALSQFRKTPCDIGSVEATPLSITLTPSITPTASNTPTPTSTFTPPPSHIDSIGILRQGTFYLRLHNTTGVADLSVNYYAADGDSYPVVLDWAGQGFDTIGAYDQLESSFNLCLANDTSVCGNNRNAVYLHIGELNDIPLGGRWRANAQGAGIGLSRPSNGLIFLKNYLTMGYADYQMVMGIPGDSALTGDWSGQDYDSPGVYRPTLSTFYLSNQVTNGTISASYQVTFGLSGDLPVVGDWLAQGHDGIGVFRPTTGATYLKNQLVTGYADNTFTYGIPGDIPLAGHWQLTYPPSAPPSVLVAKTAVPLQPNGSVQDNNNPIGD